jgi:putative DNA primase/helicase
MSPHTLDDLATAPRWVAWRQELTKKGKPTKIPYDPVSGSKARVPTDPKTYNTRAKAEQRWGVMHSNGDAGGTGIVLGNLGNGNYLFGLDLDGCRDGATGDLTQWAKPIITRFSTYAEVSPSGTGVKPFFLVSAETAHAVETLLGKVKTGKNKGKQITRKTFALGIIWKLL